MTKAKRLLFISQALKLWYTHVQILDWLQFSNAYSITHDGLALNKWDKERLMNCMKTYIDVCDEIGNMEDIMQVWYNSNSGYAYIALENGISICEAFNGIEFLTTNFENWEETFSESYNEALLCLQ